MQDLNNFVYRERTLFIFCECIGKSIRFAKEYCGLVEEIEEKQLCP